MKQEEDIYTWQSLFRVFCTCLHFAHVLHLHMFESCFHLKYARQSQNVQKGKYDVFHTFLFLLASFASGLLCKKVYGCFCFIDFVHFFLQKLFQSSTFSQYTKDAFHRYVIENEIEAVSPYKEGTKAAAHYVLTVPPGKQHKIRCRLTARNNRVPLPLDDKVFDDIVFQRKHEADEFYKTVTPGKNSSIKRLSKSVIK